MTQICKNKFVKTSSDGFTFTLKLDYGSETCFLGLFEPSSDKWGKLSRKNKTQKHNDIMRFKSCWEGRKLTNQRITLPVHILQGRKLQTSRYFYAYDDIDCPSLDSIKMLGAIYSKKSLNGSYKFIDQFRNRNLHLTSITQSSVQWKG